MLTSETKPGSELSKSGIEKRPTVRKLTLYSILPPQGILSQLNSGFIAEPAEQATILGIWEKASRAYNTHGSPTRSFATPEDLREIEDVENEQIANVLGRAKLYSPHDSHPTEIYNVRISKLITPQITINVSRAQRRADIHEGMSNAELFPVMFESAGRPDPIIRQTLGMVANGGAFLFTSYDEDIRLHHPPKFQQLPTNEKDPQSPSLENVCIPIGGGSPLATAIRVEITPGITRLILSNGIHRVYRLAQAGYEWCPLIVSDLIPMEFPDPFVELPKDILLLPTSNSPLITDFLDKDVSIPLDYYTLLRTIRLNFSFEQYVTVLK